MKEKKPDSVVHELRDCPVPPVKGAVTEPEDVIPWPDHPMGRQASSAADGIISSESWL